MSDLKAATYPNGKFKSQSMCNENKTDGFRIHWYESGQIKSAGEYKHNKRDGLCTSWYENGQKNAEINYSKGIKNGRLILWHRDGSKKSEVVYSNGRMNSLWVNWDIDGQIQKAVLFKDKRKVSKTTWYNNGQLKLQTNYESSRRALRKLPEIDWDSCPYDTIEMDIGFRSGKPIKTNPYDVSKISEKSWYENGNVQNELADYGYHYVNSGWYESGQLKYNHGHDDTFPSGSMCWHENGQLSYKLEPGTDKYISFDVEGAKEYELETRYTFDDDDLWKEKYTFFDKKGDKLCSIERDDDTLICLWYFYDKSGNKIYSNKVSPNRWTENR